MTVPSSVRTGSSITGSPQTVSASDQASSPSARCSSMVALFPLSPDKDLKHFCRYGVGPGVRHPLLSFPGTSRFVVLLGLALRVPALWAGSSASSSICPSTTGARSWPSRSQGAVRDARQPVEPMTAALRGKLVGNTRIHCQAPHATPMAAGSESAHWLLHHEEPPPPSAGQATAEKTIQY